MKIQFKILLLFILSTTLLSAQQIKQPTPPEPDYANLFKEANLKYDAEDYKECIRLLNGYSRSDTGYAAAVDRISLAYLSTEQWDKAIEKTTEGLTLKSIYRRHFYEMLGAAYDANNQPDKAIEIFEIGLKEFPVATRFYYQLGLAWLHKNDFKKAVEYFQKTILTNPFNASAHYQLGIICMNNNLMIPAMLSFQTFLLMEENTKRSLQALSFYEKLSKGDINNPKDSIKYQIPIGENNFEEIQAIVESRVALDSRYKTDVKISYTNLVKQMQVITEKINYNASDSGFWMQFYVPFYNELWQKKYFDPFAYFVFSSVNDEELQKQIKKNKSDIDKLADFSNQYFNDLRQKNWIKLGLAKYPVFINSQGNISAEGEFDEKTKISKGHWIYYFNHGVKRSEGNFNEAGKNDGEWKYYFPTGELKSIEHFKNDVQTDSINSFYINGMPNEQSFIVNNKVNGVVKGYFSTGALMASVTLENGIKNGQVTYYYENGEIEHQSTFLNDKYNGLYISFYNNSQKKEEFNYLNDRIEGIVKTWYENGKLKSEGSYKAGNMEGEWKYYNAKGKLEKTANYKSGKEYGIVKEFFENGKTDNEINYINGIPAGTATYYAEDGNVWSKIEYSNGKFRKFIYFDKQGMKISECIEKNDEINLKALYEDGSVFRSGKLMKGEREGLWVTNNKFGNIKSEENYKNGELDGLQKYFGNSGIKESEINYVNGKKEGLAREFYKNGIISKQGWYKDDIVQGEWREYSLDGRLTESYHYLNGELNGYYIYYDQNGKVINEIKYAKADLIQYTGFDTLHNVLYSQNLETGNGKITILNLNKKIQSELVYKYGSLEGEVKQYFADGTIRRISNYSNGKRNGGYKTYNWDGTPLEEEFYKDGFKDSTAIRYVNGKKEMTCTYQEDELNGIRNWYYPTGKIESSGHFVDGDKDGYINYFDEDGSLRFRLFYSGGRLQSYSYLKSDSTFVPEILLPKSTGQIKSFFRNGNLSAEISFNSNWYDGVYKIYHSNGKIAREAVYKLHELDGDSKEYYSNGTMKCEENYLYDFLNGICKYYSEKGILQKELTYVDGDLHGPAYIYNDSGKLIRKINFYNDEPY